MTRAERRAYLAIFCQRGHERTSRNTRITQQGWRICRDCDYEGRRQRQSLGLVPRSKGE